MKLSKWAVSVDTGGTYWGGSSNSMWIYTSPGSHSYRINAWCSGPFEGRTAAGNRWTYDSGASTAWFAAGVITG